MNTKVKLSQPLKDAEKADPFEQCLEALEVWIKTISYELNKQLPGYAKHVLRDAYVDYRNTVDNLNKKEGK